MDARFGVSFRPDSPQEVTEWVTTAESLGFSRVCIADSAALYREVWVTVTLAALNTRNVTVGPWVTNPITRHPVITASAAATVDELAPGRVCIGIATGDSAIYNLGLRASSAATLKAYILAVKDLLERGETTYQGRPVRLTWAKRHIPVYVAAHGSKALRLAGEVADGVIVGMGSTPEVVKASLDVLAEGARSAGRDVSDIDVWWATGFNVYTNPDEAREMWGAGVGAAHFMSRFTLEGKFIPEEYKEGIRKLGNAYDMATHGRASGEQQEYYVRLAQELGIADYMRERFGGLTGTPEECIEKVKRLVDLGINQFTTSLPGPDRPARLRKWHDLVMSKL